MAARLAFDFEWRITLLTLLLLPLLISLGFWQLQRAQEKAVLASAFERQQALTPVPVADLWGASPGALAYRPVVLAGHYRRGEHFLLDNRIQQGRYGNEVLSVFELASGALVLVNRGWLPADASRRTLPPVPDVSGEQRLTGHVYVSPGEPYLLADETVGRSWPRRLQAVEMDKIAASLSGRLFPYPVRIDAGQAGALAVDWRFINASAAKHQAYATQWFAMAAALALLYLARSTNLWQLIRGGPDKE